MKEREFWLDHIRGVACLLVVLLHSSMSYLYKFNTISMFSWHIGNTVDSFTRVSVPLFFMISGYLMMRDRSAQPKHLLRILVCIVFYSALSILYVALYRHGDWKTLIVDMYHKPVFYHLWFFYAIFAFYIISNVVTCRKGNRYGMYALLFCMLLLNPGINSLADKDVINLSTRFQLNGTFIFFMLYGMAGAMLGDAKVENDHRFVILLYLAASSIITVKTFFATRELGRFSGTYYSYSGPLVAIGAMSLFYVIAHLKVSNIRYRQILTFVSGLSLPIYGVHALLIDYLKRSGNRNFDNPLLDIPMTFFLTVTCSIVFALIIKKLDRFRLVT